MFELDNVWPYPMVWTTKMNQCNLNVWFGKFLTIWVEHLGDAENVSNEHPHILQFTNRNL
jgi:hypothetical protein